jgi:hypothetical protein
MRKVLIIAAAASVAMIASANAQQVNLDFGTGSETGNYFAIANDVAAYCGQDTEVMGTSRRGNKPYVMNPVTSGGSVDNAKGIFQKDYHGGIVQEDVLHYLAKQDGNSYSANTMKAVFYLHQEVMHVLLPRGYKPKTEESGGFFSKVTSLWEEEQPVTFDINLLKNQEVVAWGGSVVSAQAISLFNDLNFTVRSVSNAEEAMATGLPIISVGGIPYKPVQSILDSNDYLLVGLNAQAVAAAASFYTPVSVSYVVKGALTDVQTVGVRAILMARNSRVKTGNNNMIALGNCIEESLLEMADDPESSPVWGNIVTLNQAGGLPSWPLFD